MKFNLLALAALIGQVALIAPAMGAPVEEVAGLVARAPQPPGRRPPSRCHPWEWWCQERPGQCRPWEWWCHRQPPRCRPWEWWCNRGRRDVVEAEELHRRAFDEVDALELE
ncbi:hypothetical protein FPV67DRAFT_638461 [Lyophyllum atratum]|nr:hypothetical protein FPV67DRAFT_638461 [Lyophyllum atratum]